MATNNFLPYAPNATSGGTNMESQSAYSTDDERYSGALYGAETRSSLINKALRQANAMAAAHAQAVSDLSDVDMLDDGTQANLVANIKAAQTASANAAITDRIGDDICPLVGGYVPVANIPGSIQDVIFVTSYSALPTTGDVTKLYITTDTGNNYRWDSASAAYYSTAQNAETAGKFATAKTVTITGLAVGSASSDFSSGVSVVVDVPSTDATLAGSEYIPLKQSSSYLRTTVTAIKTFVLNGIDATIRSTVLTGLSTATSAVISATDTVLSAFGKLQAQITGLGGTAATFSTVAALRANSRTGMAKVLTDGYWSANDGGAGEYYKDSGDTTTADDGYLCIVDANSIRWKLIIGDRVNAKLAGVSTQNSDNSTYLQNWINSLSGYKEGFIPGGIYYFASALTIPATSPIAIVGEGQAQTILHYNGTSTTVDIVSAMGTSGTALGTDIKLRGFNIRSGTTMTAGAALHFKWIGNSICEDMAFGRPTDSIKNLYDGFYIENVGYHRLDGFEAFTQHDGIVVAGVGAGGVGPQYDVFVQGGTISQCTNGVHIAGGFDNAYFDNIMCTTNGTNVRIDNAKYAKANQNIYFGPRFVCEYATSGSGFNIDDAYASSSLLSNVTIAGHIYGCAPSGIAISTWASGCVQVLSPYISNSTSHGIVISDKSAIVTISPATSINSNGGYGVYCGFDSIYIALPDKMYSNTSGNFNQYVKSARTCYGVNNISWASITGAGTTYSGATPITTDNVYAYGVSGSGVSLPASRNGADVTVFNGSGTNLVIYPNDGGSISPNAANVGIALASGKVAQLHCVNGDTWFVKCIY